MKTSDALLHFGTKTKIAAALGMTKQAISAWGTYPPLDKQFQLEVLTKGKLKADRSFANKKE